MPHLTDAQHAQFLTVRDGLIANGEANPAGGPSCAVLSEDFDELLGGAEQYGVYGRTPEHARGHVTDGTIVDASADQFGYPDSTRVLQPGDTDCDRSLDHDGDDG